jgi:hypothetical protein
VSYQDFAERTQKHGQRRVFEAGPAGQWGNDGNVNLRFKNTLIDWINMGGYHQNSDNL